MQRRNLTTYSATLGNLKLDAFGIRQTLTYEATIEIYQARVSPEIWRARPTFSKGEHKWEAGDAESLMALITADFEQVIKPWKVWEYTGPRKDQPALERRGEIGRRQSA